MAARIQDLFRFKVLDGVPDDAVLVIPSSVVAEMMRSADASFAQAVLLLGDRGLTWDAKGDVVASQPPTK